MISQGAIPTADSKEKGKRKKCNDEDGFEQSERR